VIFQPDEAYALTEYNKDLTGVTPQNPFTGIFARELAVE